MGGSRMEEFLARSAVGEDTFVQCTTCDYAAHVEAVAVPSPAAVAYDGVPAAHAEQTPDTPTIESLVAHLNPAFPREDRAWPGGDALQNVMVMPTRPDGTREPPDLGIQGESGVEEKRLGGTRGS